MDRTEQYAKVIRRIHKGEYSANDNQKFREKEDSYGDERVQTRRPQIRERKKVKSRKQAVAIALSEARSAGARIPKKKAKS